MVTPGLLTLLAGIIVAGVSAQWLAWRVGLPSILLLLGFGVILGPITGWIDPDEIFGPLLPPIVSLSVALILYEGGLSLKLGDLPKVGSVVSRLVSLGAAVTWGVTALAARYVLGLDGALSALLAAILVVTGPTVIIPMLRHIRPAGVVGPVLRWEGIVIDPIGAVVTVLMFEVILIGEAGEATSHVVIGLVKTVILGGGLGWAAARLLVIVLARFWIADHLQSAASFMFVVATFALSNTLQHESGLLAVTVMGFALANQKRADVEHIIEFKENLGILLIGSLFVLLAARVQLSTLIAMAGKGTLFVAVLVLVARPLSVLVSTWGSPLSWRQRAFVSWMAPRGIVAAAIASVFALRLEAEGFSQARLLVPVTFLTIMTTVAVYGLTAPFVARRLGVADVNPQGVLFAGAHGWARELAALLKNTGIAVLLVDSNREHARTARMAGLPTYTGNILAEHTLDELDLGGIGRLLAVTPNHWVNVLAVQRFERLFGRANCFQLRSDADGSRSDQQRESPTRWLGDGKVTFAALERAYLAGSRAKATRLSDEFDYAAFQARYGDSAIPLFVIDEDRRLRAVTSQDSPQAEAGETIIAFVQAED